VPHSRDSGWRVAAKGSVFVNFRNTCNLKIGPLTGSLSTDPAAAGALLEAHNLQALSRVASGGGEPQVLALQVQDPLPLPTKRKNLF